MKIRLFVALLLLTPSLGVTASSLTDQLHRLVDNGQMHEAYTLAAEQQEQLAGQPEFDVPYGIAAIDSGHINEGVFALERALFMQPDNHRARLEYARGLFILGEDAEARQEFSRVLEQADPPPSVVEKIDRFLASIRSRESRYLTTAHGYLGLGFGYDDNINSAPDDQLTRVVLDDTSLGRGDQFSRLTFGGQLFHPVSKGTKVYGRWDSNVRFYRDERDQDHGNHSLTLGSRWTRSTHQFDFGLNGQQYFLDDRRYRSLYGPTAQWLQAFSPRLVTTASVSWNYLDYHESSLAFRNSRQALAHLRLFGQLDVPTTPNWFVGAFFGDERSDAQSPSSLATTDRRFRGTQLGGQLNLTRELGLLSSLTYQVSEYDGADLLYGIARKDDYYALDLGLKYLLNRHWQLVLEANFSANHSNIELYDYRRRQFGFNIRYDF